MNLKYEKYVYTKFCKILEILNPNKTYKKFATYKILGAHNIRIIVGVELSCKIQIIICIHSQF